jgi:hypothetical protein
VGNKAGIPRIAIGNERQKKGRRGSLIGSWDKLELCELGGHYRISPSLLRIKEKKERKNKVIVPLDMTKRPYIPQQDVSYMAGYGVAIKNSFLNLVPPRGTDWRFKSPPHPIHTRYAAF